VAPPGNQAETEKTNINLQQREKSDYSTKMPRRPSFIPVGPPFFAGVSLWGKYRKRSPACQDNPDALFF